MPRQELSSPIQHSVNPAAKHEPEGNSTDVKNMTRMHDTVCTKSTPFSRQIKVKFVVDYMYTHCCWRSRLDIVRLRSNRDLMESIDIRSQHHIDNSSMIDRLTD